MTPVLSAAACSFGPAATLLVLCACGPQVRKPKAGGHDSTTDTGQAASGDTCLRPGTGGCTVEKASLWYADADGDGFGDRDAAVRACGAPPGRVANDADCDDADSAINPNVVEIQGDGLDQNCDGSDYAFVRTASWAGERSGTWAGQALAAAPDMNGDGIADLVVGAPGAGDYLGTAYVLFGPISASGSLAMAGATLTGQWRDQVGYAVAGLASVTGDGTGALLIGAEGLEGSEGQYGAAYLVLGPISGALDLGAADAILEAGTEEQYAGAGLSAGADLDEAGGLDLLIGAPGTSFPDLTQAGDVRVIPASARGRVSLDAASLILTGDGRGEQAGEASVVADLDGDGNEDMVIGAPSGCVGCVQGQVLAIFGPRSGTMSLADADVWLQSEDREDSFGETIAVGDTDGDGSIDLLIGAPRRAEVGAALLLLGPLSGHPPLSVAAAEFSGVELYDYMGEGVALDDLDQDGKDDLVVSSPGNDGKVGVFLSPVRGALGIADADGQATDSGSHFLGYSLATPGDVDGNGWREVVMGIPEAGDWDSGGGIEIAEWR